MPEIVRQSLLDLASDLINHPEPRLPQCDKQSKPGHRRKLGPSIVLPLEEHVAAKKAPGSDGSGDRLNGAFDATTRSTGYRLSDILKKCEGTPPLNLTLPKRETQNHSGQEDRLCTMIVGSISFKNWQGRD